MFISLRLKEKKLIAYFNVDWYHAFFDHSETCRNYNSFISACFSDRGEAEADLPSPLYAAHCRKSKLDLLLPSIEFKTRKAIASSAKIFFV